MMAKEAAATKECFVIAPIGAPDSEIRRRSDQILKYVIAPTVGHCGYEPTRADAISAPGVITDQVIKHLIDAPLVIADLTGHNPNVLYELAIRHAVGTPCIHLIHRDESLPFDLRGMRTIALDHRDLDSVAAACDEIKEQIKDIEGSPGEYVSPVSNVLVWQQLANVSNSTVKILRSFLSIRDELKREAVRAREHPQEKRVGLESTRLLPMGDLKELFKELEKEQQA